MVLVVAGLEPGHWETNALPRRPFAAKAEAYEQQRGESTKATPLPPSFAWQG